MRNNDLDDTPVPRILLVFEGALGFLDAENDAKFQKFMGSKYYDQAADLFEVNDLMSSQIMSVARYQSFTMDLITYLGDAEWALALADRLKDEDLPMRRVVAIRPDVLARKLPTMPDVVRVYDPWPEHNGLFSPTVGRYITRADQFGRL
jgi:hypothetical protein